MGRVLSSGFRPGFLIADAKCFLPSCSSGSQRFEAKLRLMLIIGIYDEATQATL